MMRRWYLLSLVLMVGLLASVVGVPQNTASAEATPSAACNAINGQTVAGHNAAIIGGTGFLPTDVVTISYTGDTSGFSTGIYDYGYDYSFDGGITGVVPAAGPWPTGVTSFTPPPGADLYINVLDKILPNTNSITVTCGVAPAATVLPYNIDPNGDEDGDGVLNKADNCLFVPNNQDDGYGGPAGDKCDNEFFDNNNGVKIFQLKDGTFAVFAACFASQCREIARIDPRLLFPTDNVFTFQGRDARGWSVVVVFIAFGSEIYKVNVYDSGGTLQSDQFEIVISNSELVTWRVQGSGFISGSTASKFGVPIDRSTVTREEQGLPPTANNRVRPGQCGVSIGTVNVREEPSLTSTIIAKIPYWTATDILQEDVSGFWFLVSAEAIVTDANGNTSTQTVEGWAANEWFGKPGDFLKRGGGVVPDVCSY